MCVDDGLTEDGRPELGVEVPTNRLQPGGSRKGKKRRTQLPLLQRTRVFTLAVDALPQASSAGLPGSDAGLSRTLQ